MQALLCELNAEKFDKAVYGGLDDLPVLLEANDLAIYVKPRATTQGSPAAVVTFTVQLPDGSFARAQATTTLSIIEALSSLIKGWRAGGHL